MQDKLTVCSEYRVEFKKRNAKFNNTALILAGILVALMLAIVLVVSTINDIPQMSEIRPVYIASIIFLLFSAGVLLLIRLKLPGLLWLSEALAAMIYLITMALMQWSTHIELPATHIKDISVFIFGLFVLVVFLRFRPLVTFGLQTVCILMFIGLMVVERGEIINFFASLTNGICCYVLSVVSAVAIYVMHVRSFNNEKTLEQLLTSDYLTHVHNRRGYDFMLRRIWDEAEKTGTNISLFIIDVDHFKKFNDCYGHAEGDICLTRVAATITESVRKNDFVARYGGEEFAVILADTGADDVELIAKRILRDIHMLRIRHEQSEHGYVSVSIGVSTAVPGKKEVQFADFSKSADDALYDAKRTGRNKIVYSNTLMPGKRAKKTS